MVGAALALLEDGGGLGPPSSARALGAGRGAEGAGDPHRFAALVRRYQARVHRLVAGILGPAHSADAEDATQEVFLLAYRKLDSFRGDSSFSTWLYRLAYNRAIDYRRQLDRQRKVPLDETAFEAGRSATAFPAGGLRPAAAPLGDTLAGERARQLAHRLEKLPQKQRVAVHLFYWLGCNVAEIAELMDTKPATVKSHLFRARRALARAMREEER